MSTKRNTIDLPGPIRMAIVILRARLLPRWAAWFVFVGAIVVNLPPQPVGPVPLFVLTLGAIVLGAGLAWLGYSLWSEGST